MNITGALQENILTLLCFDKQAASIIVGSIDIDLFENSIYRNIAKAAVGYLRKYKKPAGSHLQDLLEDYLQDERKGKLYHRALQDLTDLSATINAEYVLAQLGKFVRRQTLRKGITEAAARIQEDDLEQAESIILKAVRTRLTTFEAGIHISDTRYLDADNFDRPDLVGLGVKVLDDAYISPARKELFTFLGPRNVGKTWALVNAGRFASMQHWKVAHITLEMSDKKLWSRYVQAFFSLTKREAAAVTIPQFLRGKNGNLENIIFKNLERRRAISDPAARAKIKAKIEATQGRMSVIVRQFPTSQLTTEGLVAYLEGLEASEGFVPDMVVIDYPELMKLDIKNLRLDIGRQFRDLRGVAVERNLAMVGASQTNRAGSKAKIITMNDMSEDISKADISDNIVSLNQTAAENKLGLMRLFVAKGRDERKGQCVLVAQSYALGQFCLDSMMLSKDYWPIVNRYKKKDDDEDDDD
jgi:replicative DNA helicase